MNKEINIEFVNELEDHSEKLKVIKRTARSVMNAFEKDRVIRSVRLIDRDRLNQMLAQLSRCLQKTALLSNSVTDIEKDLEIYYMENYENSPKLGKKLFYDHCDLLHVPYDKLKNYLWNSINTLEDYKDKMI